LIKQKIKIHLEKNVKPQLETQPSLTTENNININIKKKKREITIPWWSKYFIYAATVIIMIVCLFFIIIKGIEFGDDKVRKWLTSFLLSIVSSILLTQPLQVILVALFFSVIIRKYDDEDDIGSDHNDNGDPFNQCEDYLNKVY
jgi:hypothetical protein